jgi:single-strand DNA-binding protein
MNNVTLVGNMVRDAEIKTTTAQKPVATFTVAVTRKYKTNDKYESDFISCVAWGATAEFIAKYFPKGAKIGIVGSIQTRTYEKDGAKVYVTEVNVSDAEFVERKAKDDDEEVPFDL